MSRKGENIYKRKDGRWEGRYIISRTNSGKAKYGYIYAYTYMECKQKLIRVKAEAEEHQVTKKNKNDTLKIIASQWLDSKTPQLKPATLAKYNILLNGYIYPNLGDKHIESLSKNDIQDFSRYLLREGNKKHSELSAKTVSDIISVVRSIINFANENGYTVPVDISNIKIKQNPKALSVLSKEEQKKLCDVLVNSTDLRDVGILLCLFTGIRIGELCALKWENISIDNQTIFICSTLQRLSILDEVERPLSTPKTAIIISTPKSACSIRLIPLPDFLITILKTIDIKNGYLLTSREDSYIEPRSMQYHFKKVLIANSIGEVNFHVLRHTFATRCIELGFDVKTLSEILGHANVSITMNRYVHPSFDQKRENMNRLSDLFSVK